MPEGLGPEKVKLYNPKTKETKFYPVDTSFEPYRREAFRHRTIPPQRQSVMMTNIVGEGTVNTEGLWRREQVEWSMGAGQYSLDRRGDNQETRFFSSKGVDVFSFPFEATLLPDTHRRDSGAAANNLLMSRCGDYVVTAQSAAGVTTVMRWDSTWTSLSFNYDTVTYGGSIPTVVNAITSNDTVVFIATDTGVWFANASVLVSLHPTFQLFAANDGSPTYGGGFDMLRWANDQLVGSRGARLYAYQPRSTDGTTIPFGSPPSVSTTMVNISQIQGPGSFLTGNDQALVYCTAPHNLTNGQKVTIQGSQQNGDITAMTDPTAGSGLCTVTCSGAHGLTVGDEVSVSLTYTTGRIIDESTKVTAISNNR